LFPAYLFLVYLPNYSAFWHFDHSLALCYNNRRQQTADRFCQV